MKVFLSWSGDLSQRAAVVLRDWLPMLIQAVTPYVSSEDIDKGARWSSDIAKELEASSFGVLCVTRGNVRAPWINFEAGALSKTVDRAWVSPLLLGIKRSEIRGPLVQFQSTLYEQEEVRRLIGSINTAAGEEGLAPSLLDKLFDILWPQLQEQLDPIVAEAEKEEAEGDSDEAQVRPDTEGILEEILELTRSQQRLLTSPEDLLPRSYLASALRRHDGDVPSTRHQVWRDLEAALDRADDMLLKHGASETIPRDEVEKLVLEVRKPSRYLLRRARGEIRVAVPLARRIVIQPPVEVVRMEEEPPEATHSA